MRRGAAIAVFVMSLEVAACGGCHEESGTSPALPIAVEKSVAACKRLKSVSPDTREKIVSFYYAPDESKDEMLKEDPAVQKAMVEVCPMIRDCLVPQEDREVQRLLDACKGLTSMGLYK